MRGADVHPVMWELGRALGCGPPLAELLIDHALGLARWDPEALALADRLSATDDPWRTLAAAIRQTVRDRDEPPPDGLIIWPDETADDV
jgi:hypothetical protein